MKRTLLTLLLAGLSFLAFGAGEGLYYYRVGSYCKAVPIFTDKGTIQFEEGDWFATPDFLGMEAMKDYPPVEMNGVWYGLGPFYKIISDKQLAAIKAGDKTVVNNPAGLLKSLQEHPRRTDYVRTDEMVARAEKVRADYQKMQSDSGKARKPKGERSGFWLALLALLPALGPVIALYVISQCYVGEEEKKKEYKDRSRKPLWGILMLLLQAGVLVGYYFILAPKFEVPEGGGSAAAGKGLIWALVVAAVLFVIFFCSGVLHFHKEMYSSWDLRVKPVLIKGGLGLLFLSTPAAAFSFLGIYELGKLLGVETLGASLGAIVGVLLFCLMPYLLMRKAIIKQNPAAKPMVLTLVAFDLLAVTVGVVIAMIALAGYIVWWCFNLFTGAGAGVRGIGVEDLLGGERHCGSCALYGTPNCPSRSNVTSGTPAKHCYKNEG